MSRTLFVISILGLLNFYVFARIVGRWPFAGQHMGIVWLVGIIIFLLQLAAPISNHIIFPSLGQHQAMDAAARVTNWLSYGIFGVVSCLFVYVLAIDIFDIVWKLFTVPNSTINFDRRALLTLGAVTVGTTALGLTQAAAGPTVKEVTVPLKNLPPEFEGFKIVQISDLHVSPLITKGYVDNVVKIANSLDADMFALTGDFVDGQVNDLREDIAPLATLKSKFGSYYITGNHEYYWGAPEWIDEFRKMGAKPLLNQHDVIKIGDAEIVIAGVNDYSTRSINSDHAFNPAKSLEGAPQDRIKILLAHQPNSYTAAEAAGFDLQLSGHTHAGQYFPFQLFIGLFQRYYQGLNRHNNMWIYVNRGTGYWGPPLRTGVPSEITLMKLTRAA